MGLDKSHKVAAVIIIIAAFLVAANTLLRPSTVFRYNGVQIYDAIRDFRNLESRGFDVTVHVEGSSGGQPFLASGGIVETYTGWFVLKTDDSYRIVEGPMGSKDVLAGLIYFDVSPAFSVEAVYEPYESGTFSPRFSFEHGFRKVRGSIAFDKAEITSTAVQRLRDLNEEFYSVTPNRIQVTPFGTGIILDIKVPVPVSELEELVESIGSGRIRTGYMYYYTGADDEEDINEIKKDLESKGAVLVNYYPQR
ncbi:MAG: hypothetical protein JXC85_00080 [Candidatus Aenigmarchaeota archaeon]|nr:hypothetical protein [Candidatus Aenigmarchaeota archaeon]